MGSMGVGVDVIICLCMFFISESISEVRKR